MAKISVDWHLYQTFLAVVRAGSLSGAARALGATQPTVGRQVAALEKSLQVSLFTRSREGLTPTATALQLVGRAEAMAAAAADAERHASADAAEESGTVRITASEIVGAELLPPVLAQLQADHPRLVLELVLTNRNEDLLRGDADIAVRMVQPTQKDLVARRLGTITVGLYAHRRYLKGRKIPRSIEDLRSHALIGFDRDRSYLTALERSGIGSLTEFFTLRTDSQLAQLAALRAGGGIGLCQQGIAERDRSLIPLLADRVSFPLDTWLVMHRDARGSRRIRLVYDHLVRELRIPA
jgi:DNA-binding transcriptional LysR family regulator